MMLNSMKITKVVISIYKMTYRRQMSTDTLLSFFSKVNSVKSADKALFLNFKFFIQVKNKNCFIDVGLMTFWISS